MPKLILTMAIVTGVVLAPFAAGPAQAGKKTRNALLAFVVAGGASFMVLKLTNDRQTTYGGGGIVLSGTEDKRSTSSIALYSAGFGALAAVVTYVATPSSNDYSRSLIAWKKGKQVRLRVPTIEMKRTDRGRRSHLRLLQYNF